MNIEQHLHAGSTASLAAPDALDTAEQSGMPPGAPRWVAEGNEPLVASSEGAALQVRMLRVACGLLQQNTAVPIGTPLSASLFPLLLDTAFFPSPVSQRAAEDREREQLAIQLHAAFEREALENGFDHPAETVIADALASSPRALEWIQTLSLDKADPGFAASLLRCLGRLERPGTSAWRASVIREALLLDEVQIRDAAAQAADSWADRTLIHILAAHEEPESWLRQFILDIVDDLQTED